MGVARCRKADGVGRSSERLSFQRRYSTRGTIIRVDCTSLIRSERWIRRADRIWLWQVLFRVPINNNSASGVLEVVAQGSVIGLSLIGVTVVRHRSHVDRAVVGASCWDLIETWFYRACQPREAYLIRNGREEKEQSQKVKVKLRVAG